MTNGTPRDQADLPVAAVEALRKGQTIEAIKILRQERGLDLRDAKQAVDQYVRANPSLERAMQAAQAGPRSGCAVWALGFLALLAAGYYFLVGR
jgi:ribosomal protein L7/L12